MMLLKKGVVLICFCILFSSMVYASGINPDSFPYGNYNYRVLFHGHEDTYANETIGCGVGGTDNGVCIPNRNAAERGLSSWIVNVCNNCDCDNWEGLDYKYDDGSGKYWNAEGYSWFFIPQGKDMGEQASDPKTVDIQPVDFPFKFYADDNMRIGLSIDQGAHFSETLLNAGYAPNLLTFSSNNNFLPAWTRSGAPYAGWWALDFSVADMNYCKGVGNHYYILVGINNDFVSYYFPAINNYGPLSYMHLNEGNNSAECFDGRDNDGDWSIYNDTNGDGKYTPGMDQARSDVGLDGCSDPYEDGAGGCLNTKRNPTDLQNNPDPNNDDYGSSNLLGTEGNGKPDTGWVNGVYKTERAVDCGDPDCYGAASNGRVCPNPGVPEAGTDPISNPAYAIAACNDHIDNDLNGLIDMNDTSCNDPTKFISYPYDASSFGGIKNILDTLGLYYASAKDGSDAVCGDDQSDINEFCFHEYIDDSWNKVTCRFDTKEVGTDPTYLYLTVNTTYGVAGSHFFTFDDVSLKNVITGQEYLQYGNFDQFNTASSWTKLVAGDTIRYGLGLISNAFVQSNCPSTNTTPFCTSTPHALVGYMGFSTTRQKISLTPYTSYILTYWTKRTKPSGPSTVTAKSSIAIEGTPIYGGSGDIGYIDPTNQYLCLNDIRGLGKENISYNKQGNYSFWNAQVPPYYRIHQSEGTSFVSNLAQWNYCDPQQSNAYKGNSIKLYDTFIQGVLPGQSTCAQLFVDGTYNGECSAEITTNCCKCDGYDCGNIQSLDQCMPCYKEYPDQPLDITTTPLTFPMDENYTDTKNTFDPENLDLNNINGQYSCTNNSGVICGLNGDGTVCTSDKEFYVVKSSDADPSRKQYCCINKADPLTSNRTISCQLPLQTTCESQGGSLCQSNEACQQGHILQSSETSAVCCDSLEYCYNPQTNNDLFTKNVNNSFICYEENNNGYFAECCSEYGLCYNKQLELDEASYDKHAFGVGSPLHSLNSFEFIQKDVMRTRVLQVKNPRPSYYPGTKNLTQKGKSNFNGYDTLELSFLYSNSESTDPHLRIVDESGNIFETTLLDYSVNGNQAGKWHRVKFNLSDARTIDLAHVYRISVGNVTDGFFWLDNIFLSNSTATSASPNANYYCSGYYKQWVDKLEPTISNFNTWTPEQKQAYAGQSNVQEWGPYKDVCKYNLFKWTGSQCCGNDQLKTRNETYEDAYAGCWAGDGVYSNKRLSESTRNPDDDNVMFYDGQFRGCEIARTQDGLITTNEPAGTRLGAWVCTVDGVWDNGNGINKTSRLYLASKLYDVSAHDFTLSCGKAKDVANAVPLGSDTADWFVCILNNDPLKEHTEMKKVYVGILYNDSSALLGNISAFAPFNELTATSEQIILNETYLESCTVAGDNQNMTKCPELVSGSSTLYGYHNADQKIFIFGFEKIVDLEHPTIFQVIWQAIKNFFVNLFSSNTQADHGTLENFPLDIRHANFEKFYFARTKDKTITGIYERTGTAQGQNVMKIDYVNFNNLNLSSKLSVFKQEAGITPAVSYAFGCNKSTLYVTNLLHETRGSPEKYWRLFTSNIHITTFDDGKRIGNCNLRIVCGDGTIDAGETCEGTNFNGKTCASETSGKKTSGQLICSNCSINTSQCFVPPVVPVCGNNLTEGTESCDGTDLNGKTCQDFGFSQGTLSCKPDCTYTAAGCGNASYCDGNTYHKWNSTTNSYSTKNCPTQLAICNTVSPQYNQIACERQSACISSVCDASLGCGFYSMPDGASCAGGGGTCHSGQCYDKCPGLCENNCGPDETEIKSTNKNSLLCTGIPTKLNFKCCSQNAVTHVD
jgi:hypothetical protein